MIVTSVEFPRLRNLDPVAVRDGNQVLVALQDPTRTCQNLVVLTPAAFQIATLMDGQRDLQQLCADFAQMSGQQASPQAVADLIDHLDRSLALDSATSREHLRTMQQRPAMLAGHGYPAAAEKLGPFLDDILSMHPLNQDIKEPLRGLLLPHIDLKRGDQSYACAWQETRARLDNFDTFVILGISHAVSRQPFILTRMHFQTPLGLVESDQAFLDELQSGLDFDPYFDEFNHVGEHSVEFQAVWLRHLLKERPFKIVPVLCGSFHPCLLPEHQTPSPKMLPGVSSFLSSLQHCLASRPKALVIASVDFAHVGQRFGGPSLDEGQLERLKSQDSETFSCALDRSEDFIASLRSDRGQRNYCGTPAIYTLLEMLQDPKGRLLHYQQCIEGDNESVVTVGAAVY